MRPYDPVISALEKLLPNAQYTIIDGHMGLIWEDVKDINGNSTGKEEPKNLIWKDSRPLPVKLELENAIEEEKSFYQSTAYQRRRRFEYPSLEDLADALYWQSQGDSSKMTAYLAAVDAVKTKYPKGTV